LLFLTFLDLLLTFLNPFDQPLENRLQMGLVVDNQGIVADHSRVAGQLP
jgi:hypothetical protein